VRILESRLGVKVFDRTSRRVRLTPAGGGAQMRPRAGAGCLGPGPGRDQ
jgi:DNA-binding transcriptional LysR family regulator